VRRVLLALVIAGLLIAGRLRQRWPSTIVSFQEVRADIVRSQEVTTRPP
jgi:hypothetical protein